MHWLKIDIKNQFDIIMPILCESLALLPMELFKITHLCKICEEYTSKHGGEGWAH